MTDNVLEFSAAYSTKKGGYRAKLTVCPNPQCAHQWVAAEPLTINRTPCPKCGVYAIIGTGEYVDVKN